MYPIFILHNCWICLLNKHTSNIENCSEYDKSKYAPTKIRIEKSMISRWRIHHKKCFILKTTIGNFNILLIRNWNRNLIFLLIDTLHSSEIFSTMEIPILNSETFKPLKRESVKSITRKSWKKVNYLYLVPSLSIWLFASQKIIPRRENTVLSEYFHRSVWDWVKWRLDTFLI